MGVTERLVLRLQVAVRSGEEGHAQMLTNDSGEVTSHIQGMFNRTIRMLSCGIRPAYVFDGRPPALKSEELAKRLARREQAQRDLERAKEEGWMFIRLQNVCQHSDNG
jgi:flap endonuclease-1